MPELSRFESSKDEKFPKEACQRFDLGRRLSSRFTGRIHWFDRGSCDRGYCLLTDESQHEFAILEKERVQTNQAMSSENPIAKPNPNRLKQDNVENLVESDILDENLDRTDTAEIDARNQADDNREKPIAEADGVTRPTIADQQIIHTNISAG